MKSTKNSERLGQQVQPGIEPGPSRLPALRAEPLNHWWGARYTDKNLLRQNFENWFLTYFIKQILFTFCMHVHC